MAACDTKIYTETGDLNGEDTLSDTSLILDGKGSTREGKTSPRLGHRKSSRIRKRGGTALSEVSYSSSDDSDPNIHIGDSVLFEEEEKMMMIKEESEVDSNQRTEKQILAVALMKSVIETNAGMPSTTNVVKIKDELEGEGGGGGHISGTNTCMGGVDTMNDMKKNENIIEECKVNGVILHTNQADKNNNDVTDGSGQGAVVPVGNVENSDGANNGGNNCPTTALQSNVTATPNAAQIINDINVNTNVRNVTDVRTEDAKRLKVSDGAENVNISRVDVLSTAANTQVALSAAQRGTRSRSKGGRTMALKGAYASIREAPRLALKQNVSIVPVPNPILNSPAPIEAQGQPIKSNIKIEQHQQVKIEQNVVVQPVTSCSQDQTLTQCHAMPVSQPSQNETATTTRIRTNSVSFMMPTNHPGSISSLANTMPRRRIFSIDLDPEGFDFDLSIGVACNTPPPADYTDSDSALPPITSSSSIIINNDHPLESSARNQRIQNTTDLAQDSSMSCPRSRGLSFELFSFAQNEILSSSDPADLQEEALNGGRPRGDSIIFDPVSFSDGGIHEETALQRLRRDSIVLEETDEIELMNTPGFIQGPISQTYQKRSQPQSHRAPAKITSINHKVRNKATHRAQNKATSRGSNNNGYHLVRQSKSSHTTINTTKSRSQVTLTVVSGNNISNNEDTIHMPQGSAAAAAAAASLSSQVIPCSLNGSISHTACPMELLNKGGRIGIYLPDARRQRIAKFHSKRKNRIWRKRIKYDCRKKLADSRPRIKGRFVKSLEE